MRQLGLVCRSFLRLPFLQSWFFVYFLRLIHTAHCRMANINILITSFILFYFILFYFNLIITFTFQLNS